MIPDDISENYIEAAQQLYWYCVNNHEGQNSTLYQVLSQIDYKPGPMETGPDSWDFYEQLHSRELDPQHLLEIINECFAELD